MRTGGVRVGGGRGRGAYLVEGGHLGRVGEAVDDVHGGHAHAEHVVSGKAIVGVVGVGAWLLLLLLGGDELGTAVGLGRVEGAGGERGGLGDAGVGTVAIVGKGITGRVQRGRPAGLFGVGTTDGIH